VLKKSGWDKDLSPDEFAIIEKISFRRHQARGAHAWLHVSREFRGAVGRFPVYRTRSRCELHHLGPLTPVGTVVLPFEGHAAIGDPSGGCWRSRRGGFSATNRPALPRACRPSTRTQEGACCNDPFVATQWRQIGSEGMTVGGGSDCQRTAGSRRRGRRGASPGTAVERAARARGQKEEAGRQEIHLSPSREMPPPGTIMCACG
jgi:hypothetical protein